MALLSFADSTPRAYRLKVGNAYFTFSTSTGTSPQTTLMDLTSPKPAKPEPNRRPKTKLFLGRAGNFG
jgi:hypothetical protein